MLMSTYRSPEPTDSLATNITTARTASGFDKFSRVLEQREKGRRSHQGSTTLDRYDGLDPSSATLGPSGSIICESYKNVDFFSVKEPY